MEKSVKQALELRKSGDLLKSNQLFVELLQTKKTDSHLNYQVAWSYDLLGQESQAVAYYVQAIDLGLSGEDLSGALLGLGSTYRCLGEYQKAKTTLEQGIENFPDNQSFKVFYAMTLYNLKEYTHSFERLLKILLETTEDAEILRYKKAVSFYAEHLDEIFLE